MKKYLLFTLLALAIASFGGTTVLAHAQVTGSDTATLQQQLQLMKEKLQLLQLQQTEAGTQTVAQTVAPASITVADAAALNSALSALATTLVNLQSAVQNDSQFMTKNGPIVARSLAGIENSLAAVLISMQSPAATGVANAMPKTSQSAVAANPAVNSAPLVIANNDNLLATPATTPTPSQDDSLLPSVDSLTQPAVVASALDGKNRLPAIIVGIILLAMIAILVWGRGGENLEPATVTVQRDAPKSAAPITSVQPSISFVSNQSSPTQSVPMPSQDRLA